MWSYWEIGGLHTETAESIADVFNSLKNSIGVNVAVATLSGPIGRSALLVGGLVTGRITISVLTESKSLSLEELTAEKKELH